jgi:hypothetical protein
MFSNNSYTDGIKPTCKLKYKKTNTPLLAASNYNRKNFNNYIKVFKPAQQAALKRARVLRMKAPVLNKAFFNAVLESAKSKIEGRQQVVNLRNAGYRVDQNAYDKFIDQLNAKFAVPKKRSTSPTSPKYSPNNNQGLFYYAKQEMALQTTYTGRAWVYSEVWKKLPVYQRKVLAHFRNHGKWLPKNHFKKSSPLLKGPIKRKPKSPNLPMPIPLNSPRTTRRKNIETGFNAYWKELNKNNRNTVRSYIAAHQSPNMRKNLFGTPSPDKPKSPSPSRFTNALKNINTLKTAKARAEWIMAKRLNFKKDELTRLKNHVKSKNNENRALRASRPSKNTNSQNLIKYGKHINTLKTAKARAEWLKAKKPTLSSYQVNSLRQYIKTKNQANKNRRAAKKNLKK